MTPAGGDLLDHHPALPPESPLEMPVQSLRRVTPGYSPDRPPTTRPYGWRRGLVIGGTILLTVFAATEMYRALAVMGLTPLEAAILVLFVSLFAWIAFSFTNALAGFICMIRGYAGPLPIPAEGPIPPLSRRTALLLPIYNEEPERVMAGLQVVYESVVAAGGRDHCHFFILSDSTDPLVWIAEEAAFLDLRARTGGHTHVFYRRRRKNIERKAGNIADWVTRFGGAYDHMLILDADSVMSGDTILRLAAAMERHPEVGLIQTLPTIANANTLFARLQQFASRLYGPIIGYGLAWWHGGEGNYWGHNAIIRTRAFADQAGMPHLKGRGPFAGHIMSHDFVEAALMRRGGWAIHMAPHLGGSYEEAPPSFPDFALRDRRWCQGNLQHSRVLSARGLHWVNRLHLLTGIGSYVTAPLWLLFLVLGALISLQARFARPRYFGDEPSLFPNWPAQDPERAIWVFVATMSLLLAPKFLGFLAGLITAERLRGFGGMLRAALSVIIEILLTGLMAPLAMLIQSIGIFGIVTGRDIGWNPQRRDDGSIPFAEVAERYWPHTLFGLMFGVAALSVSWPLLLWMSPVILGPMLSIPLVSLTASRGAGVALRRAGLLLVPEEQAPPAILQRLAAIQEEMKMKPPRDLGALLRDPAVYAAHRAMLPPPRRAGIDPIDADLLVGVAKVAEAGSLDEVRAALTPRELAAVLADPEGVELLRDLAREGGD